MLNLFRVAGGRALERRPAFNSFVVLTRPFASDASTTAVATSSSDKPETAISDEGPDNSLYPNAPIRKFFEETRLPPRPNGMPQSIPVGRPWFARELRLKSFEDLHKLHFVLLVERNKLLNEKFRHRKHNQVFPSPERLKNVRTSMARLQTVLTERAHESMDLKMTEGLDFSDEKPELTEAQEKWFRARNHLRKPREHRPSSPRASGGQKTKRKMQMALEFEADTLDYIAKLEKSRKDAVEAVDGKTPADASEKLGIPVEKPRWRNLSVDAQVRLREKQKETRTQKLVKQMAQSESDKLRVVEERDTPDWTDRPELAKLRLRAKAN